MKLLIAFCVLVGCGRDENHYVSSPPPPVPVLPVERDVGEPPASMVSVPAGTYQPPCTYADDPISCKHLTWYVEQFFIDRTEVTVGEFRKCVERGACKRPDYSDKLWCNERGNWQKKDHEQHPMNCVEFEDALAYCKFRGKRLPLPEEWMKAAGGDDRREYPWGNERPTCELAVMKADGKGCEGDGTQPVGSRPKGASPYGALDMAGNVSEIVLRRPTSALPDISSTHGGDYATDFIGLSVVALKGLPASPAAGFRCARRPSRVAEPAM